MSIYNIEDYIIVKNRQIINSKHKFIETLWRKKDIIDYIFANKKDIKKIIPEVELKIEFLIQNTDKITLSNLITEINKSFRGNGNNRVITKEYWTIRGWTEEEAKEKVSEIQRNNISIAHSKCSKEELYEKHRKGILKKDENFILQLIQEGKTEKEAKLILNKKRQSESHFCLSFWLNRGYSEAEATLLISRIQSKNAKTYWDNVDLDSDEYKQSRSTRIEYWIAKGYSEEEAKEKLSERQRTFSLEKCIERQGEEEGTRIWGERQVKWQKTLQARDDYEEIKLKRISAFQYGSASRESLKVFIPLYKWLRKRGYERDDILFGIDGSCELLFTSNGKTHLFDFTIKSLGLIIEYNGIAFHPKSKIDEHKGFALHKQMTISEKWEIDRKKIETAEKAGYSVLEIWSDESKLLEKCKRFIENKENNNNVK